MRIGEVGDEQPGAERQGAMRTGRRPDHAAVRGPAAAVERSAAHLHQAGDMGGKANDGTPLLNRCCSHCPSSDGVMDGGSRGVGSMPDGAGDQGCLMMPAMMPRGSLCRSALHESRRAAQGRDDGVLRQKISVPVRCSGGASYSKRSPGQSLDAALFSTQAVRLSESPDTLPPRFGQANDFHVKTIRPVILKIAILYFSAQYFVHPVGPILSRFRRSRDASASAPRFGRRRCAGAGDGASSMPLTQGSRAPVHGACAKR